MTADGSGRPVKDTLWLQLPLKLGRELARDRGLRVSKAPLDLLHTFGDPPPLSFVVDTWPVLVEHWLSMRPNPRVRLARALHRAGAGAAEPDLDSRHGQLQFLSSCDLDNSTASVVLAELTDFAAEHYESTYPPDFDRSSPELFRVGRLRRDGNITMRVDKRPDLSSYLDAKVNRRGDLILEGQDLGEYVERMLGSDGYEYSKTYKRSVLRSVLEALDENPDADIMDVITARWCGTEASFELERRLDDAGISCKAWSRS